VGLRCRSGLRADPIRCPTGQYWSLSLGLPFLIWFRGICQLCTSFPTIVGWMRVRVIAPERQSFDIWRQPSRGQAPSCAPQPPIWPDPWGREALQSRSGALRGLRSRLGARRTTMQPFARSGAEEPGGWSQPEVRRRPGGGGGRRGEGAYWAGNAPGGEQESTEEEAAPSSPPPQPARETFGWRNLPHQFRHNPAAHAAWSASSLPMTAPSTSATPEWVRRSGIRWVCPSRWSTSGPGRSRPEPLASPASTRRPAWCEGALRAKPRNP
jgi:hypothetical protein